MKIALFITCLADVLYPNVGQATMTSASSSQIGFPRTIGPPSKGISGQIASAPQLLVARPWFRNTAPRRGIPDTRSHTEVSPPAQGRRNKWLPAGA